MANIEFIKAIDCLMPLNDEDKEALKAFKIGDIVKGKITKPRNLGFHRKYFAMIKCFLSFQSEYKNSDEVLDDIKLKLRMYDIRYSFDKKVYPKFHSISFAKMDNIEFSEFYSKSFDVLLKVANEIAVNKASIMSIEEFEDAILKFL